MSDANATPTPTPVKYFAVDQNLLLEVLNYLAKDQSAALYVKLNQLPALDIVETKPEAPATTPTV